MARMAGDIIMIFPDSEMKPIYLQISAWLETEILSGKINSGDKIYSQYQLAEIFNINPATAAKGLNILADEKILYKKRGLGMFVSYEAGEIIRRKRREQVRDRLRELVKEAELLDISESELITMLREARKQDKEERT